MPTGCCQHTTSETHRYGRRKLGRRQEKWRKGERESWSQKTSLWHAVILFNVNFRCAHIALGKLLVSFSSFTTFFIFIQIYIYNVWLLRLVFVICAATFDNVNRIEHSRKPKAATISVSALAHFLCLWIFISAFPWLPSTPLSLLYIFFIHFHCLFVWLLAEGASRKIPLCHRRVCQFVANAVNII